MGKGSSGAARRAQKAKNLSKKNEKEEKNVIPSGPTDHESQTVKINEESKVDLSKLEQNSSELLDPEKTNTKGKGQDSNHHVILSASDDANFRMSNDTHSASSDNEPEPETGNAHSANHPERFNAPHSNEMEMESLKEQINALESELQEMQQALAESHQSFAEQIVQMSATKDLEKDSELLQLQESCERCQSDLTIQKERVRTLEMQLEGRDRALEEKSTILAENAVAIADMQAKITVRDTTLLQDLVSKAYTPTTESLAKVAVDLGYTIESDYVRCSCLIRNSLSWRKYDIFWLTTAPCGT